MDGICGPQTWAALVEAGYRLGDRLLYRRRPMLRGDDVAELQRQLGALGFDAGRVDGIFGDTTAVAVADFQRNVAIAVDGICGRVTADELARLSARSQHDSLVMAVREREQLRLGAAAARSQSSPPGSGECGPGECGSGGPGDHRPGGNGPSAWRRLVGHRIGVGQGGGLGAAAEAVSRALSVAGADTLAFLHPDGSHLAAQANAARVDAYLGLHLDPGAQNCVIAYYAGYRYESPGGRRLAELVRDELGTHLGLLDVGVVGMSLPELRESQMPAVVCELAPPQVVVEHSAELGQALRQALTVWAGPDIQGR